MKRNQPIEAERSHLAALRVQFCQQRYEEGLRLFLSPSATVAKPVANADQK